MQHATISAKQPTLAAGRAAWSLLRNNGGARVLRRKCTCGGAPGPTGECEECRKKKLKLQRKLAIGATDDPLELEADQVADQVLSKPSFSGVGNVPPRIQRYSGQSTGQMESAPASVDQALSSPGRPLEPALRRDMEQRFGHDFSQVRVHSGTAAEQSAREVNAHAYTVGHNMVFGAGRLAPETQAGRRLIAHELTHVVQSGNQSSQTNRQTIHRQPDRAGIEAEIQVLRVQLMAPVNPLRSVQEARLIQLEAMLNRIGGRGSQPAPPKPKPYLDRPFMFRFSKAWYMAKEAALQEVRKNDKTYRGGSITRGLIDVQDLAPSADAVWKAGIYGGLFKNDEKGLVDEVRGKNGKRELRQTVQSRKVWARLWGRAVLREQRPASRRRCGNLVAGKGVRSIPSQRKSCCSEYICGWYWQGRGVELNGQNRRSEESPGR